MKIRITNEICDAAGKRKKKFLTAERALMSQYRARGVTGAAQTKVYQCQDCGWWHTTRHLFPADPEFQFTGEPVASVAS